MCYTLIMGLLKKLLKTKSEQEQISALNYMYKRLKIAQYQNMSMQDYFDKHYRANCYYYSTYILLCMKPTDRLVRGCIHIGELDPIYNLFSKDKKVRPNYEHGWIEFEFKGKWWVYDDHYKYPIRINDYYKLVSPYEIYKKLTQNELLDYVKSKYPNDLTIKANSNITEISTKGLWIDEYKIPLYYTNILIKDGVIKKIEIDKNRKVYSC